MPGLQPCTEPAHEHGWRKGLFAPWPVCTRRRRRQRQARNTRGRRRARSAYNAGGTGGRVARTARKGADVLQRVLRALHVLREALAVACVPLGAQRRVSSLCRARRVRRQPCDGQGRPHARAPAREPPPPAACGAQLARKLCLPSASGGGGPLLLAGEAMLAPASAAGGATGPRPSSCAPLTVLLPQPITPSRAPA